MSEPSISHLPHVAVDEAGKATHPWQFTQATDRGSSLHNDDDPVTEWLLDQRHLDANEFAVLFAIHKFNAGRRRYAGIRRTDLCRSSGLDQVSLTRVLTDLRHRGLIGISRHRFDSSRACYMLMVR